MLLPVYAEREQPQFCSECGAMLVRSTKQSSYNKRTGQRVVVDRLQCPKRNWLVGLFKSHDRFESSDDGHTWFRRY